MSIIGQYGTHKDDFDKTLRNAQEMLKLASAPLIIYKIKVMNP